MSANSSSCDSPLPPPLTTVNSSLFFWLNCLLVPSNSLIYSTFTVTNTILVLPLSVFILCYGLQRWWQQRSTSTAPTTHSDSFTYHLIVMELICVSGYISCCCGVYRNDLRVFKAGYYCTTFTWYGATFFHLLTCVEHYLAVIHPITYLSLRKQRGIRIRNLITGCIWLFSIGGTFLEQNDKIALIVGFCLSFSSLIMTSFCSLSVLCALLHSGPGNKGRERVDQSKLRAFYTIVAILGVLLLRLTWNLYWILGLLFLENINGCYWITCDGWVNLSSSLVLPLLFLQRTLGSCKNNAK